MRLSVLAELWNTFFFKMVSPYPVAAFRIFQGLMIIQVSLYLGADLKIWFESPGIILLHTLNTDPVERMLIFSFFPNNNEYVFALWILYVVTAILFTIGYQTRIVSIVLFFLIINFTNRNLYIFHAGDTFMRTMAYWLMFVPSGEVWSVDSYLKRRRNPEQAPYCPLISAWAWRALQIQMCFVYFSAFTAKTPGWYWASGEACYIASRFESLYRLPMPLSFDVPIVAIVLTYGTLIVEFALFSLIWIKEIRYYVIALGVCLHLSIDWCMCIPSFEWLMISSFVLFVYPEDLDRAVGYARYWIGKTFKLKPLRL